MSDDAYKAAAASAAAAIRLTQADLPAGWTGKPHTDDHQTFDLSPECAAFNVEGAPNAVLDVNSDDFTDAENRSISSEIIVYRTAALAIKDSTDAADLIARCRQEIASVIEAAIVKDAPGATASVSFDPTATNGLGGWSGGYTISISVASASGARVFHSDVVVYWRLVGRVVVFFEYDGETPIDAGLSDTLKSFLAKRTADAEATLPG